MYQEVFLKVSLQLDKSRAGYKAWYPKTPKLRSVHKHIYCVMGNHSKMVKWALLDTLINALHVELCTLQRNLRKCSKLDWDSGKWRKMTSGDDAWQYFSHDVSGKSAYLDKWEQAPCLSSISYLFGWEWTWQICSTRPHLTRPNISQLQWWSFHATAWNEKKIGVVLKLKLLYTVPLKCKIPVTSRFSRDGNLVQFLFTSSSFE